MRIEAEQLKEMVRAFAESDGKRDAGLVEPADITKIRNLSYGEFGEANLLDLYYPQGTTTKLPVIVNIHGGGYFYGDKELYRFYAMNLAKYGFIVVNFNYRLSPDYLYPTPLEDINNVMNWLVTHQTDYPMDLAQLFVLGDSAGGQLTEQYATLVTNPAYAELFDFQIAPITIKGVGLNCGAYYIGKETPINQDFPFYFGAELPETTIQQFPVEDFITKDFPAAHITTATHDFLKDVAEPLAKAIQQKGGTAEFHLYADPAGGELGHVFHIDQKSAIAEQCNREQINFFKNI